MLKRLFDLMLAGTGIVILSPVMAIIGLTVAAGSKGGVFYRQKRVGKDGREFTLYKFRTMRPLSDRAGLLTVGNADPRVTRIGHFLRRYKLDELPQLLNVLNGSMSIVGPRPEVKRYVDMYSPEQKKVLAVKPGITDLASLKYIDENALLGRSPDPEKTYIEEIMPAKLELNRQYIEKSSFLYDLKIIAQTLFRIVKRS